MTALILIVDDDPIQRRLLEAMARRFGYNAECLDSGEATAAVQKDFAEAQRLGLSGTPSFFVNGHFFSGIVKYNTLREMVQQELAAPIASNRK